MLEKRPAPWLLPIIVPRGAKIDPSWSDWPEGYVVEVEWKWIIAFVLAGIALYSLAEKKGPLTAKARSLGDLPKKAKTKRLYYMQRQSTRTSRGRGMEIISLPRAKARGIIRRSEETGKQPARDLFPVYASSADEARDMIIKRHISRWKPETVKGKPKQMTLFGGISANCKTWERWYSPHLDREVWRCEAFDPACEPPDCTPKPKTSKAKLRICTGWTRNFSFFYGKDVSRCAKYSAICGTKACITSPAAKPDEGAMVQSEVEALAREMARREKESQTEFGPELARQIKARGGIAPYRGGFLKEEYAMLPLHLKNRKGLAMDEMASEMGLTERQLVVQIQKAYGVKLKPKSWDWTDYEQAAYEELRRQGLAQVKYKEQDLFPGLRREMVLEMEDVAKSDDPVTRCLERKGWSLARISQLRNSIISKRQPDVMTGKVKLLSRSENELEAHTDECFRKAVARPSGPPVQQSLLGKCQWYQSVKR